ncbi:glycosyltransferase [Vibrio sp. TRT 2004]|uniref:glycosyltransferase n=1 Tax=Vibrio sp. TRT 2004 TaxID=3418506 RepID=UPI003CF50074
MKKLSIIVVTYNAEECIESTLLSVRPFLGEDVELICKDGASSDNTVEILNQYSDCISVLESIPDSGVYDGMNQAVDLASGEFIMFVNAGDRVLHLDTKKLVDSSTCFYWDEARDVVKRDKVNSLFLTRNTPCHQSVIYKRTDFLAFDVNYGLAADFEQIVRIVKARDVGLSLNSSIVKYATPGLSSQFFQPSYTQLLTQLRHRYRTISNNFGMIERTMCIVFSITTVLRKLMKDILK